MKKIILITALFAIGTTAGFTQTINIDELRRDAERGDAVAQYKLGRCFHHLDSCGVQKDFSESVKWIRKAAEQGIPQAQGALGWLYFCGEGVPQNFSEAVKWYRKAAEQGDGWAQNALANYYWGVSFDFSEAVKWYRKAAEQGEVFAQNALAGCYYNGRGVSQDFSEAAKWFRKAAEQGNAPAQINLAYCYDQGHGIEKDEHLALYWYSKSLEKRENFDREDIDHAEKRVREIKINLPDRFSTFAKKYVQDHINKWQEKGEFERTADWQNRVNETTRNNEIAFLSKEAEDIYTRLLILSNRELNLSLERYDADNEVFLIRSKHGDLLVPVPFREAQTFRANWNSITKAPTYFIENDRPAFAEIAFITSSGQTYKYSNRASLNYTQAKIEYNFAPIDIIAGNTSQQRGQQTISNVSLNVGRSDVAVNIPIINIRNDKTFAVIIANENYRRESQVEFAKNDGEVFKEYCIKTLGIPANNIRFVADATLNDIRAEIDWLTQVANAFRNEANIIFYYAGHGIPDESSRTSYLLPVDGLGSNVNTAHKLDDLYQTLGSLPVKSVVVFMDACFSGAQRSGEMLASARGVAIRAQSGKPVGNMVVFSAAQGDETAFPYREKGHGMFTYFLLKKLQETKGDVTLGELGDYIETNVQRRSIVVNLKSQTPTVVPANAMVNSWRSKRLKP